MINIGNSSSMREDTDCQPLVVVGAEEEEGQCIYEDVFSSLFLLEKNIYEDVGNEE